MKTITCALYEHYLIEERHLVSSMEHSDSNIPDKYWNFLGFVKLPTSSILGIRLKESNQPLEVSEEMFEIVPELNQLVKI